jgi:hypothetical protein
LERRTNPNERTRNARHLQDILRIAAAMRVYHLLLYHHHVRRRAML